MVKEVNSVKEITDDSFVIKYGQEFCIPCEITENNLKALESDFNIPFYSTKNVNESVEKGFKALPVIELHKNGEIITLNDNSIMMNQNELKGWLETNA